MIASYRPWSDIHTSKRVGPRTWNISIDRRAIHGPPIAFRYLATAISVRALCHANLLRVVAMMSATGVVSNGNRAAAARIVMLMVLIYDMQQTRLHCVRRPHLWFQSRRQGIGRWSARQEHDSFTSRLFKFNNLFVPWQNMLIMVLVEGDCSFVWVLWFDCRTL